jgi:hypothetical protein
MALEEELAKEQVATTVAIDVDNDIIMGGKVLATAVDSDKVGHEGDAKDKVDSLNEKACERSVTIELKVLAKSKATKLPKRRQRRLQRLSCKRRISMVLTW